MRTALITRLAPVALALSAACAVGPNYERPTTLPTPLDWRDTTLALKDSS